MDLEKAKLREDCDPGLVPDDESRPQEKEAMIKNEAAVPAQIPLPRALSESTIDSNSTIDRGTWGKKLEFMLTCISYAVGLGNFWRFPYLCYKNGGGAFLIPYFTMLAICGMPIFFMELAFGQFASLGPLAIWKVCPIFKGIGHSMVLSSLFICIYFAVIISYVVFYFFSSFTADLPWENCGNDWNTANCMARQLSPSEAVTFSNNVTNATMAATSTSASVATTTPSEEYFFRFVLRMSDGIENIGAVNWPLLGALAMVWILACLALIKGIHSLGKVSYLTATFPYICITALLINAVQLDGAKDGIIFYLTPDFSRLLDPQVWSDAAIQIFYSMGPCIGSLIMMGSFNKFDNNCKRDTILVCLINCLTSFYGGFAIFAVLGFMAKQAGVEISKVAQSGPGLTFVVYPEGLAQMPAAPVWCVLFFAMMFIVGMGTLLGMFEAVLTAVEDEFPICRRRRSWFRVSACAAAFLLGFPQMTQGGFYIMNLMDANVGGFNLLIIGVLEISVVMFVYGYKRFSDDIALMLGRRPELYWRVCWQGLSLITLTGILVFMFFKYTPPTCGDYVYPQWAVVLGWLMTISTVVSIPLLAVLTFGVRLFNFSPPRPQVEPAEGVSARLFALWRLLAETFKSVLRPDADWGPAVKGQSGGQSCVKASEFNFVQSTQP